MFFLFIDNFNEFRFSLRFLLRIAHERAFSIAILLLQMTAEKQGMEDLYRHSLICAQFLFTIIISVPTINVWFWGGGRIEKNELHRALVDADKVG